MQLLLLSTVPIFYTSMRQNLSLCSEKLPKKWVDLPRNECRRSGTRDLGGKIYRPRIQDSTDHKSNIQLGAFISCNLLQCLWKSIRNET